MISLAIVGEDFAARFYRDAGYRILGRNIRHIGFEVDLLAHRQESAVLVEVKCRRGKRQDLGSHQTLLAARKRDALARAVAYVESEFQQPMWSVRLDLALVTFDSWRDSLEIDVIENIGM